MKLKLINGDIFCLNMFHKIQVPILVSSGMTEQIVNRCTELHTIVWAEAREKIRKNTKKL